MPTTILMNVLDEQELRVAVIREGRLEHLSHERGSDGQHLGNIYKARVANVEPSLDAAFLDLGAGKNGFIHIDEIRHDQGAGKRIEQVLQSGQEILVQITKEAIKDKGPCCSMYLSVAGRYLVLMNSDQIKGVSKRIEDQVVRKRLKNLLASFEAPDGFGFIVRTAGADRSDDEIRLDYEFLKKVWEEVDAKATRVRAPACLYQEADVVVRTLRDLGAGELSAIVIDQERLYDEARAFAQVFMPEISNRIQLHREELPLFSYYGLEERLASLFERKVPLPSGGTIVIEQTEALVSIDVNSSRNRAAGDVETTAMMVNLEAVSTIAEQLVLRDLGGLIIIDFIDMENREHQKLVQLALRRALAGDKAKIQVGSLSRFGLVEMTRQRTRPSHKMLASAECPYCIGTGSIKTAETFEIDCMRAVRESLTSRGLSRLEVVVPHDLAIGMLNARHKELTDLEERHDCRIVFTGDSLMKAREFRLIPTARKGERQTRGAREQPIRPSLLAPLMVERAKALQLARELAAMKPADLERELEEGEIRSAPPVHQPVVEREGQSIAAAAAPRGPATIFDEAIVLRRLLFGPVQAVTIADGAPGSGPSGNGQGPRGGSHGNGQSDRPRELAPSRGSANVSRRRSGGRGRRR